MSVFLVAFALLSLGFGGMAIGRLWGREPIRACGQCGESPCVACPSHREQETRP